MNILQFFVPHSLRNYNYIAYDSTSKDCYIFDPYDSDIVVKKVKEFNLSPLGVLNTHYHHDHTRANQAVADYFNIPIIKNDFDELKLGEDYLKLIKTPGHTSDHVVFVGYQDQKQDFIIAGDTIFNAGVGNCKNGGNPEVLYATIKQLDQFLEDDVKLFPSHDYLLTNLRFAQSVDNSDHEIESWIEKRSQMDLDREFIQTTIGDERKINPFFRLDHFQKIFNLDEKNTFLKLRKLRDVF